MGPVLQAFYISWLSVHSTSLVWSRFSISLTNLAHTSPAECFWVKVMQWPWTKFSSSKVKVTAVLCKKNPFPDHACISHPLGLVWLILHPLMSFPMEMQWSWTKLLRQKSLSGPYVFSSLRNLAHYSQTECKRINGWTLQQPWTIFLYQMWRSQQISLISCFGP